MAREWLAPGGSVLMDVYCPFLMARRAGMEERLAPLPGAPGSLEMIERCLFYPVHCRWIDEWVPEAAPDKALAQTVRCYTPADLLLLLEGTGLTLKHVEVDGQPIAVAGDQITLAGPLMDSYYYLAQLVGGE